MARRPEAALAKIVLPTEGELLAFIDSIEVATKDYGLTTIGLWGTQRYLLRQILQGVEAGIRQFIVIKARQVGASTLILLLTLYWMLRYPGLQGATITDGDENRDYFRDVFLGMNEAREEKAVIEEEPTSSLRTRNRIQIAWPNRSRLTMQTAGPRTWKRLGVGRGLAFCHGTEVPLWAGEGKAITFLRSAFSDIHPAALYVLEGTARGRNWYYDLWHDAKGATTMRQVFLGWWLREDYRIPKSDRRFKRYGSSVLSARELAWADELRRPPFAVTLTTEQWAWRRWYVAEKAGNSETLADQEMPTVPEDAFGASQERPFLEVRSEERVRASIAEAPVPERYVYHWGATLEDSQPRRADADEPASLRVWTPPDPTTPVVVAAVPGYTAMDDDPTWAISVWGASLEVDELTQLAEFATEAAIGMQPFAWACLHLAACYAAMHRSFILELSGIGSGVLQEMKRLMATGWGTAANPRHRNVLGGVRHYIWRRPDSFSAFGALQWKSTAETQGPVLYRFRDQIARGSVKVRSPELAAELRRMEGQGDSFETTGREPRGHRAMAGALAVESWSAQLHGQIRRERAKLKPAATVGARMIDTYLSALGGTIHPVAKGA